MPTSAGASAHGLWPRHPLCLSDSVIRGSCVSTGPTKRKRTLFWFIEHSGAPASEHWSFKMTLITLNHIKETLHFIKKKKVLIFDEIKQLADSWISPTAFSSTLFWHHASPIRREGQVAELKGKTCLDWVPEPLTLDSVAQTGLVSASGICPIHWWRSSLHAHLVCLPAPASPRPWGALERVCLPVCLKAPLAWPHAAALL